MSPRQGGAPSHAPAEPRRARWRLAAWPAARRRLRLGSCPVCHGRVRPDDALGLVGRSVSHAECALAAWIGPARLARELE